VIFLDDNAQNIAGAEELGIRSILVRSTSQMNEELQNEGISS